MRHVRPRAWLRLPTLILHALELAYVLVDKVARHPVMAVEFRTLLETVRRARCHIFQAVPVQGCGVGIRDRKQAVVIRGSEVPPSKSEREGSNGCARHRRPAPQQQPGSDEADTEHAGERQPSEL